MLHSDLYQLSRVHINSLSGLFTESFKNDPLYCKLIPDEDLRGKVLPQIFESYLDMFFDYFQMYADSEEINGAIVIFNEHNDYSHLNYQVASIKFFLKSVYSIIKAEHSLKTALRYMKGHSYLESTWADKAINVSCMHVDYLAVRKECRGKGIATKLLSPVLQYADKNKVMVALETHNSKNVTMYNHFGFKTIQKFSKYLNLNQYCMIR